MDTKSVITKLYRRHYGAFSAKKRTAGGRASRRTTKKVARRIDVGIAYSRCNES